jgi:hypothetical protein
MMRKLEKGVSMKHWMRKLGEHHERMRKRYGEEDLMVIFDIDDTILDLRHMVIHVLRSFDRHHDTTFFARVGVDQIEASEAEMGKIIRQLSIPARDGRRIASWFEEHSWSSKVIREAHRPFPGVMEVIRWFQGQPKTAVGINTGRPESIRDDTLRSLNSAGRPHNVVFTHNLLFMNPSGWNKNIVPFKIAGIDYFQKKGFRVIAFVDNEPENLEAVSMNDRTGDILLLHADTVYTSLKDKMPRSAVSGRVYDIAELRRALPRDQLGNAA